MAVIVCCTDLIGDMSIQQAHALQEAWPTSSHAQSNLYQFFKFTPITPEEGELSEQERAIARQVFKEIRNRLSFLVSVGLNYLSLNRTARTLSGGESQRIRLASQIGTGLSGVLYVLDEPSTGLHFEDVRKLLVVLHSLVAQGNTVVVIEHNLDIIRNSEWVIDLGPEGGDGGGRIIAAGTVQELAGVEASYTGQWLSRLLREEAQGGSQKGGKGSELQKNDKGKNGDKATGKQPRKGRERALV